MASAAGLAPSRSLGTANAGPLDMVHYRFVYSCSCSQLLAVCSSERVQWVTVGLPFERCFRAVSTK